MLSLLLNKWTYPVAALLLMMGCSTPAVHIPDTVALISPKSDKAIVFIHGLNGHPISTWTNEETQAYWPEMLRVDPDLPEGFSVYSLSYNAQMFNGNLTLNEMGQSLKSDMKTHGLTREGQYKEIYFVAHSMGNLALRSMLANDPTLFRGIKIPLVLSLGSPSEGSELASVGRIAMPGNSALENLSSTNNKQLEELNKQWALSKGDTVFSCGYETLPTSGVGMIVNKPSALAVCDGERFPISANHSYIAKPRDRKDRIYAWARNEILAAVKRIRDRGDIQFTNAYDSSKVKPAPKDALANVNSEPKNKGRANVTLTHIKAAIPGFVYSKVGPFVMDMVPKLGAQIKCSELLDLLENAYYSDRSKAIQTLTIHIEKPVDSSCIRRVNSFVYSSDLDKTVKALLE
jgi:Putative serine esterase (DUF676)